MDKLDMAQLLDLSDVPGIDGEEVKVYEPLQLVEIKSNPKERTQDLETDYELVRKNMHYQQQMLFDMSKICLETAKNSESPKFVEVFASLMGQYTTSNKELLKLHKDMKDITDEKVPTTGAGQGTVNINSANVFVGGPADLMDELGDAMDEKERIRLSTLEHSNE